MKSKRDRALLALLLACGLRRQELAALTVGHLQQREGHWAMVDLRGKAGHVRPIPVPDWVTGLLNNWTGGGWNQSWQSLSTCERRRGLG